MINDVIYEKTKESIDNTALNDFIQKKKKNAIRIQENTYLIID